MKTKLAGFFLLLLLIANTQSSNASSRMEAVARRAVSESPAKSGPAIAELRAAGPAGLQNLFELYGPEIERHIANPLEPATPEWQRLSAALDAVSQQKDSYLSGLYWYTDLAQAEAAAKSSGKPILSLRLLGKLNEEFSCANSRYFRTVLYSNADVSQALRERFVLHWGEMGARWGVNRSVAQIHALLWLVGRPLPADDIADSAHVRVNDGDHLGDRQH